MRPNTATEKTLNSSIPDNDFDECFECHQVVIPKNVHPSGKKFRSAYHCEKCRPIVCERETREAEKRRKQEHEQLIRSMPIKLKSIGVPKRFINCSKENYQGKIPKSRPAFISGPVGTGKTHLAVAYLREMILEGEESYFVDAVELFLLLRDSFREGSAADEREIIGEYRRKTFLVIDDLGAEKITDYVRQTFYSLINYRYGEELPTLITSNLAMAEIAQNYGDRLASRIVGMGPELRLAGKDRRLEGKK